MERLEELITELAERALAEDAAGKDITTGLLVGPDLRDRASIMAKGAGIISGHEAAEAVFRLLDESVVYTPVAVNGSHVESGDRAAIVEGNTAAILSGERTALNFLQHLSGVATLTSKFVERVKGSSIVILDTRKTTPGHRILEKRAVVHGGGENHRLDLSGSILVKENHIKAAGGLDAVMQKLGSVRLNEAEIEVSSLDELRVLRKSPPARVMLDNFTPRMLETALEELAGWGDDRPGVEVSGGIDLSSIGKYIRPGVDFISIGSLTTSAPALDLSLIIEETEA